MFYQFFVYISVVSARKDCLLEYTGKTSTTTTGRECQRWDTEYPHIPKYQPKNSGHNRCRNPDKDPKGPWCYTTDPNQRYEYCDVTDCNDGTEGTCWSQDIKYSGTVHHTITKIECQRWDKNKPHRPKQRPRKHKSQKNYCRNPDNDPKGPWCYTMDPDVRFEYCNIPNCEDSNQVDSYSGDDDQYDDSWIVQDNNDYSYIDWSALLDEVFGGSSSQNSMHEDYDAYDYNSTNFDEFREEYQEQFNCQTLSISEPGSDYIGTVSVTSSGRKCQNWEDQAPHSHGLSHYGNHNYCRNYDFNHEDAPLGIWCYTKDSNVKWEFCDQVPVCNNENSDDEINTSTDEICGVPAVDPVWGRAAQRTGLPSRLSSRGKLLNQQRRQRYRRTVNLNRRPMTWMEMLKEYQDNPIPQTRIMGGDSADEKNWPWQAGIRLRNGFKLFCGGTIISSKFVLSAAHCFEKVRHNQIFVTAGHIAKRYQGSSREPGFQQLAVDRIISHEAYDPNIIYVDIAMLKIKGHWQWSEYVQPACLPENEFKVTDNAVCAITGWGVTDGDKDYLNQATIPMVNFQRCRRLLDYAVKDHTQVCAGNVEKGGIDTCQGDSGGPLMCVSGGVWKIVGITSWGFGCGDRESPGVYTNVAKYRQWINYWVQR